MSDIIKAGLISANSLYLKIWKVVKKPPKNVPAFNMTPNMFKKSKEPSLLK